MNCCPTTYWCTADGPVGVEADADGVFTPPAGATSAPYATEDEALEACPPPPLYADCGDCGTYTFPPSVTVSFVNKTGAASALPNSFDMSPDTNPLGAGCLGDVVPCYGSRSPNAQFGGSCSGSAPAGGFALEFYLGPIGLVLDSTPWTLNAPWTQGVLGTHDAVLTYLVPCNTGSLPLPSFVGTVTVWDGVSTGSADMYIS